MMFLYINGTIVNFPKFFYCNCGKIIILVFLENNLVFFFFIFDIFIILHFDCLSLFFFIFFILFWKRNIFYFYTLNIYYSTHNLFIPFLLFLSLFFCILIF